MGFNRWATALKRWHADLAELARINDKTFSGRRNAAISVNPPSAIRYVHQC